MSSSSSSSSSKSYGDDEDERNQMSDLIEKVTRRMNRPIVQPTFYQPDVAPQMPTSSQHSSQMGQKQTSYAAPADIKRPKPQTQEPPSKRAQPAVADVTHHVTLGGGVMGFPVFQGTDPHSAIGRAANKQNNGANGRKTFINRHTGGSVLVETSTRSSPWSAAISCACWFGIMPS